MTIPYVYNFPSSSNNAPIVVNQNEINGPFILNRVKIVECIAPNLVVVYDDYLFRFKHLFNFYIKDGVNAGNYTVNRSQYMPKTNISAIDTHSKMITIPGDYTLMFTSGRIFSIQSSTYNTGSWSVSTCEYDGTYTKIYLKSSSKQDLILKSIRDGDTISSAFIDGYIELPITVIETYQPLIPTYGPESGYIEYIVPDNEIGCSLIISGKGAPSITEHTNRNVLDLLSNFSNNEPPTFPITGQQWYNTTSKQMHVFDKTSWYPIDRPVSITRQKYVAVGDEYEVSTPAYTMGSNQLAVYCDGIRYYLDDQYYEFTSMSIKFKSPLRLGQRILFEVIK